MDNVNTNAKESRKKYLAPLLVLLLCAVSLTGAAYAYTSSVAIVGNNVTSDEFVLQVYKDDKTTLISDPITVDKVTFYPVTNIVAGVADSVTVKAEASSPASYIGKLTIKATGVSGEKKFNASVDNSNESGDIAVTGATSTLAYTITAGLYTDAAGNTPFEANSTMVNFVVDGDYGVATLYYKVEVTVTGTAVFENNATPEADNLLVKNAFNAATVFNLTFEAVGPIA